MNLKPIMRGTNALDVVSTAVILATCAALLMFHWSRTKIDVSPAVPKQPVSIEQATVIGNRNAPIAIIEFSDFQCPFCRRFAQDTWPKLKAKYVQQGLAFVVFRNLPLVRIHPHAQKAAAAAVCADAQGKFLEMYDRLFGDSSALDGLNLTRSAADLGLNLSSFEVCLDGDGETKVAKELDHARALGVSVTPTFLIGVPNVDGTVTVRTILGGAASLEGLGAEIDRILHPYPSLRSVALLGGGLVGALLFGYHFRRRVNARVSTQVDDSIR